MNIAQLRDIITTLLTMQPDLIGSYTLPDGQQVPAIYVTGRSGVPPEWKVSGLEVNVYEFPRLNPRPGVGILQQRKLWTVTLVDYSTNSQALTLAADRICRRFPDASLSPQPETDTTYGQYRITIPDVEIARLITSP